MRDTTPRPPSATQTEPAPAATASALPGKGTDRVIELVRALTPVTEVESTVDTHAVPPETATSVGRPGSGTASETPVLRLPTAATELVATSRAAERGTPESPPRPLTRAAAEAAASSTDPPNTSNVAPDSLRPGTGPATPSPAAAARIISSQPG